MKQVDLSQILDLLINEDAQQASTLLHNWFVSKSKEIHESMMQDDDEVLESDRLQDLEDDKDAIESEEFYGEGDLAEDDEEGAEDADFGGDEPVAGDDDVAVDGDAPVDGGDAVADEPIEDRVEDLEATLADLKAQFATIMGADAAVVPGADEVVGDEVGDEPVDGGVADLDEPAEESFAFESEEADEDKEEVEETLDETEEVVFEDEDFIDLEESFELETVKDPGLQSGKEIGDDGSKFAVNDKSPIPQKKGPDRVGGKPVEIKAKEHKGYEREAAPEVKKMPLLKNQVKNSKDGMAVSVSKEGDKSALLNKKDGFGSDSPKSPIGAGAADLRGSDFKRK